MALPPRNASSRRALLCLFGALCLSAPALAVSCPVIKNYTPSEAEQAFLQSQYDRAAALYEAALVQQPNDPTLVAGLTQVLLQQQKVSDADALVEKALAQNPNSAPLLTALGEIQYRAGTPWLAAMTATKAMTLDPCYPRLRLLQARIFHLSSNYASAAKEVSTAYALDPHDPNIRLQWLETLPLQRRIAELESYLASKTGQDSEQLGRLGSYLAFLEKEQIEPHKACRMVSTAATTSIDFSPIMRDATHVRAYGLDVKLNDHNARLQIDTGASGLLISRSVAEHAGLTRFTNGRIGGIGNDGEANSYTAFADTIKIGSLEFHDCEVEVLDKRSVLDEDGLIGMDVFAHFLVTLDYPMRKLTLGPLPKRPDDVDTAAPTLQTAESRGDDAATGSDTAPTAKPSGNVPPAVSRSLHDRYVAPEMKNWSGVYRVGHELLMPASLNQSSPRLFILDTGAFATSVSETAARAVTKVHTDETLRVRGISGKVAKVYSADQIDFRFANMEQKVTDAVAFENSAISKGTGLEVSGFLGATTLSQLTITIDYRDGLVHFAYDPNRGYRFSAR
jgi:predicted aspartyl protease/Flp pilus assembly protein TadD